MSTLPPKVLVFDSGLGGLTVAREIRLLTPHAQLLYYADNAFFPYGTKPEHALLTRVLDEVLYLQREYQPDIVVLACNTASTLVLPHLRKLTATPIVGVVPAVKPAAQLSNSGVIGLLATPGTVLRQYTTELIRQFAGHCEVVSVGSDELVRIAENKLLGEPVLQAQVAAILAPFHQHPRALDIDTIVLACTHFPLLREELQTAYGRTMQWLDSGKAIARRVEFLLSQTHTLATLAPATNHHMLCSAPLAQSAGLEYQLRSMGFGLPQQLQRFGCN
jgi:glutamate racemase